jgi:ribonuclease VapC
VHSANATVVSLDSDQVQLARTAYEKYGKGHHPAALNLGDCCSYALACSSGEPLLFKGNDFSKTDVSMVIDTSAR